MYGPQNGLFKKANAINEISEILDYSYSHAAKVVRDLVEVGFLVKNWRGDYNVVSVNKCWEIIGIDLTPHPTKNRLGNFKIFKIAPLKRKEDLILKICTEEIRYNFSQQEYVIKQATKKNGSCPENVSLHEVIKKEVAKKADSNDLWETNDGRTVTNQDISLSNKGLCKILGLTSTGSSHLLQQRLKARGFIDSIPRSIQKQATPLEERKFRKFYPQRCYNLKNGIITKTLTNKIVILL